MTTEKQTFSSDPSTPTLLRGLASQRAQRRLKWVMGIVLLALLAVAVWLLFTTSSGREIRTHPQSVQENIRSTIAAHPLLTPAVFLAVYVLDVALGVLPVWWLQILAGIGFGLWFGTFWSVLAATISAPLGVLLSRWLAGDWYHQRVEARIQRLRNLDEMLGHNGFLVVMTLRLVHIMPFGLSNFGLGLINVSYIDVVLGTFLGSIPSVALSVGIGAGYRPRDWRFLTALVCINVFLLLPIAARYLRPQWFRKIGVE
jgi:uncharacterized membrane protein YdjX (TVP38/TMEM64 family)